MSNNKLIGGGSNESTLSENKYTNDDLRAMQGWSLDRKIQVTQTRLIEWYKYWNCQCYISFSGGKDSTVLAFLAAKVCKMLDCKLILWFADTGLEYPEVRNHVKAFHTWIEENTGCEVETIFDYPRDRKGNRITFKDVILNYGYPIVSKEQSQFIYEYRHTKSEKLKDTRINGNAWGMGKISKKWLYLINAPFEISNKCCNIMKKSPSKKFEKRTGLKPVLGTIAEESQSRISAWKSHGCNAFNASRPTSQPMSFWVEQDILECLIKYNVPYATVYGDIIENNGTFSLTGVNRTGCMWCAYGCHLENEPNRFQKLKLSHPKIWDFCMKPVSDGGLGMKEVLEFINVNVE